MLAAICATWASDGCADCGHTGSARPAAARRSADRPSSEPHKRAMNRRAFTGRNSAVPPQSGRIPPSGISRAYTRDGPPGPCRPSRKQMTSPRGRRLEVSPSGPRARSSRHDRACTPAPSCPGPRTASGRRGAARRGRPRSPAPRGPAPGSGTQRVPRQERGPGPAPARTVAPARRARPLPVQLALHLRRAAHPCRTVHGRLDGQRRLHKAKPAAVPRAGCRDTLFELGRRLHVVMESVNRPRDVAFSSALAGWPVDHVGIVVTARSQAD